MINNTVYPSSMRLNMVKRHSLTRLCMPTHYFRFCEYIGTYWCQKQQNYIDYMAQLQWITCHQNEYLQHAKLFCPVICSEFVGKEYVYSSKYQCVSSAIRALTQCLLYTCLPILHLLSVHPGSQTQVPGLSQTPFSQGGRQTAEERNQQMAKFHDKVTCVLKLTTIQSSMLS